MQEKNVIEIPLINFIILNAHVLCHIACGRERIVGGINTKLLKTHTTTAPASV
jgi:hypothetical protein